MKLLPISVLAAALLTCFAANATVITFDDLIQPGTYGPSSGSGFVDFGYVFSSNMDAVDVSPSGGGWSNGVGTGHSGKFAALNNYGGNMSMTQLGGGTFSVQDLWLNGWQGNQQTDTIVSLLNGNVVGSVTATFDQPWTNFVLNFGNIDTLQIISSNIFLVDDIQVNGTTNKIPEPGSLALVGIALAGMAALRKRKAA
ncbi:PEP-CTERM sorting domain-containing protein [Rhodoferax sp.]|uniref:PEP-CTERM sorting domain-containing protein n=1 Tax=Rhodoferax sp. TaxID=50421 RepID=UPI0025DE5F5F|nr:PEP-CTERM sorting domain-containing protein [Rhodoferax sp.]